MTGAASAQKETGRS